MDFMDLVDDVVRVSDAAFGVLCYLLLTDLEPWISPPLLISPSTHLCLNCGRDFRSRIVRIKGTGEGILA